MAHQTHSFTLDTAGRTYNAQTLTASASGTAIDLTGAADVFAKFAIVIDWSGLDVASGNELYRFQVQGATTSAFSTAYVLEEQLFGDTSVTTQPVDTPATGRKILYCDNVAQTSASDANSLAALRWIRLSCIVSGTSPTITVTAHIVPLP